MSLLNDALRKKEGESREIQRADPVSTQTLELKSRGKRNIVLILCVLLLIGVAVMFAWDMFVPDDFPLNGRNVDLDEAGVKPPSETIHDSAIQNRIADLQSDRDASQSENGKRIDTVKEAVHEMDAVVIEPETAIFRQKNEIPEKKGNRFLKKKTLTSKKKQAGLKPKEKSLPDNRRRQIFYQKALVLHAENQLDQAERMYLQVLREDPDHLGANFNLAAIYLEREQYLNAYTLLEKCRYLDPDNPRVWINLAIAALGMGDTERALTFLDQAEKITVKPWFEIGFHRGVAYSRLGNFQKALYWYKEAEKVDPRNLKLLFNIGLVFDYLKQYPEALTYYNRCLRRSNELSDEEVDQITERAGVLRRFAPQPSSALVKEK